MRAEELRLGNYVNFIAPNNINLIEQVESIHEGVNGFAEKQTYPVPITKEYLIKFGFAPSGGNGEYRKGEYSFDMKDMSFNLLVGIGELLCYLNYVHQLQNIYFSLTQEEL